MTTEVASLRAVFTADNTDFKQKSEAVKKYLKDIQNEAKQQMAVQKQQIQVEKQLAKEAENAAKAQAKAARDAAREQAKAAREHQKSQEMMISGLKKGALAAAAFGVAVKKAYDFAKQGAQIEFTKIKFDRLAQSIGTTGDSLLNKLRPATRGVMSDMELISSATDTMSLGLVNNEKDAVRLSTVMAGLGMDMNQVVLALSNQTTMRFDQLGVAVVGFDDKLKKLKESGMDADAAFTEAFLQQAEEQLVKVGHAADTSLGQFMQFEAGLKNFSDTAKTDVARSVGSLIKLFNDLANTMPASEKRIREHTEAIREAANEEGRYIRVRGGMPAAMEHTINSVGRGSSAIYEYYESLKILPSGEQTAALALEKFKESMSELSNFMRTDLTDAQNNYNASIADLQEQLGKAKQSERSGIIDQINAETEAYNERARAILYNITQQAVMAEVQSGKIDAGDALQALGTMAEEFGLIDKTSQEAYTGVGLLIDRLAEGDVDGFNAGIGLLGELLTPIPEDAGASATQIQEMDKQLAIAVELFKKLPPPGTAFNYTFFFTESGMPIPSGGGGGGGGGGGMGMGMSDINLKTNIQSIANPLNRLCNLHFM